MKSGGTGCVIAVLVLLIGIPIIPEMVAHENSVKNGYVDDTTPPRTFIEIFGKQYPQAEEYFSDVKICIYAIDDYGMGEIHYLRDGKETVVPGDIAKFAVTRTGGHNIEYWGVDAAGNEEIPHNSVEFRIVCYDGPFVYITFPWPGLYLFGNLILSFDKVFIIGSFPIEADVYDYFNEITNIEFYLDDTLVGTASTPPYSAYCTIKHFGAGKIKAKGIVDENSWVYDILDITYYKFFSRGSL